MADRIQQRRDTAARWAQFNPILLEGEIGYVLDDPNLYKVGDGVNAWNNLPLRGYNGNVLNTMGNNTNAVMSQAASTMSQGLSSGLKERSVNSVHAKEYYESIKFIAVVPNEGYEGDDFSIYAYTSRGQAAGDTPSMNSLNLWILEDTLAKAQEKEVNAAKYMITGNESMLNTLQFIKQVGPYCTLYAIIDWNPVYNYKNTAGLYSPLIWSTSWTNPSSILVQKIKSDDPRIINWDSSIKTSQLKNTLGVSTTDVMSQKTSSSLLSMTNGLVFNFDSRNVQELKAMQIIKKAYFSFLNYTPTEVGIGVIGTNGAAGTDFWFGFGRLDGTEQGLGTISFIPYTSLPTGVKSYYVENKKCKFYVEIDFDKYIELGGKNIVWSWSTPICKMTNIIDKNDQIWDSLLASKFNDKQDVIPIIDIVQSSENNNKIKSAILDARLILDNEDLHDEFWNSGHTFVREGTTYTSEKKLWGVCQSTAENGGYLNWYWMFPNGTFIPWNSSFRFTRGTGIKLFDNVEYFVKKVTLDDYGATLYMVIDWNKIPIVGPVFSGNYLDNDTISQSHNGIIQTLNLFKQDTNFQPIIFNDFTKLNFGVDGDSITAGNQWSSYVTQQLKLANHHNVAVGSSTFACRKQTLNQVEYKTQEYDDPNFAGISGGWQSTTDPVEIQKRCNNCAKVHIQKFISEVSEGTYPTPDIFAFSFGTNDNNYGTAEDALNGKSLPANDSDVLFTMAGGARWAIQKIMMTYPNCRIFVLSPIQSSDVTRNNNNLTKIEILKEICQGLSVQFIDMYSNCGITEKLETGTGIYLSDGLHTNSAGQKLMGAYASAILRNTYFASL